MTYRLILATIPNLHKSEEIYQLLDRYEVLSIWHYTLEEGAMLFHILIRREKTEAIMNLLQKNCQDEEGFRMILLPVEASIPLPETPVRILPVDEEEKTLSGLLDRLESPKLVDRLSRHEIYADIADLSQISRIYLLLIVLSALVAAIGIINNNVAVIIGAMVVAPMLGPNVAWALGNVLGDSKLEKDALKTSMVGILTALMVAFIIGMSFPVDTTVPELLLRTRVGLGSVTLALSSGIIGALSFMVGFKTTLVGVMVAVALMPPLVSSGILLGSGNFELATGALLLFMVNLVSVNLTALLTFKIWKLKPLDKKIRKKAQKNTLLAVTFLIVVLMILIFLILLRRGVFNVFIL